MHSDPDAVDMALITTQSSTATTSSTIDSSINKLIVELMRHNLACLIARVIRSGSWQLLIAVFEGGLSPAGICPTLSTHIFFFTFSI
jgi:hypothetical protein